MLPGINVQEFTLPPMADKLKNKTGLEGFSYKYFKADMDDLEAMMTLQEIMTKGTNGSGEVLIVDRSQFTFMDRCFQIIQFLQKNPE